MTDPTKKLHREARLRDVPLDQMRVNPQAQRELRESWIDHLHTVFDLDKMQPPHVNERDGHSWIMDGQHSIEALKRWLGDWKGQQLQCWTYKGLTVEQEAEMFLSLNNKLAVKPMPKFRAAVLAGRPTEADIDRIVRASGMTISDSGSPASIQAVTTLLRIYNRSGGIVLGRTIRLAHQAYGKPGLEAAVLDGLGLLCQRFNGELDDQVAIERLGAARGGAKGLLQKAEQHRVKTDHQRVHCVAAAAVEIINGARGGKKLPSWWKS